MNNSEIKKWIWLTLSVTLRRRAYYRTCKEKTTKNVGNRWKTAILSTRSRFKPYYQTSLLMGRKKKDTTIRTRQKPIVVYPETPKPAPVSADGLNHLYFGDCLDVLKELSSKEPFIDLIYIDPPFNSKRNYNVLFEHIDLKDSNAQKQAFADTWSNVVYVVELNNLADLNKDLFDFVSTLDKLKSISDSAVAYLTTMAHRIYYMHKILKTTGSFYIHCDPTMSHYLKIICDIIFGESNFKNEITWQRTNAHNMKPKYYGRVHDIILFYTKSNKYTWNEQYTDYSEEQLSRFKADEKGKLYKAENLTFSSPNPNRQFEWRGVKPPPNRSWGASLEQLEAWWKQGRILKKKDGKPRMDGLKIYLEDLKGKPLNDWWGDIARIGNTSSESLGYPTQKPEILLERIISASSNEGDVVADFFCGCGTTIAASEKLKRRWLGADISHLAIRLISKRLVTRYGQGINDKIKVHGFPKDVDSAKMLARDTENGRFGFQEWVIEVLLHGVVNQKKVADGGYDGYLTYSTDDGRSFVLIETKSGNVNVKNMREFIQVVEKQKAAAGIFVCFKETVTRDMLKEAKAAGTMLLGDLKTNIDKIQILTVDDLLHGKQPHLPNVVTTFKQAERAKQKIETGKLF